MMGPSRSLRIGNVSGATGDAAHAMRRMAEEGDVDVIVGEVCMKSAAARTQLLRVVAQPQETGCPR